MVHYLKHFQRLLDDLLNSDIGSGFNDLMNRLSGWEPERSRASSTRQWLRWQFPLRTAHGRTARPCRLVTGHTHVKRNLVFQFHNDSICRLRTDALDAFEHGDVFIADNLRQFRRGKGRQHHAWAVLPPTPDTLISNKNN